MSASRLARSAVLGARLREAEPEAARPPARRDSTQNVISPERAHAQALDDRALVFAMRAGDEWAWSEYMARARPVVTNWARRAHLRDDEWSECVDELLADVGMHLAHPKAVIPSRIAGYLVNAALLRRRQVRRNRGRADARMQALFSAEGGVSEPLPLSAYSDVSRRATDGIHGAPEEAGVVLALTSAFARRAARGRLEDDDADVATDGTTAEHSAETSRARAVRRLARLLVSELRPVDVELLIWHSAGVTHREGAAWLGISPAAAAKRIARLIARLATRSLALAATFPHNEREALQRLRGDTSRSSDNGQ